MDQQKTILKKDQTTGTWLAGKVTVLVKFYYDLTMPDLADCADQEQFEYTITLQFEYTITLQNFALKLDKHMTYKIENRNDRLQLIETTGYIWLSQILLVIHQKYLIHQIFLGIKEKEIQATQWYLWNTF